MGVFAGGEMGVFVDAVGPGAAYDGYLPRLEEGIVMDRRKRSADALRCGHGSPVVVEPAPGGRVARCLLCGNSGPVRPTSEGALAALRDEARRPLREAS